MAVTTNEILGTLIISLLDAGETELAQDLLGTELKLSGNVHFGTSYETYLGSITFYGSQRFVEKYEFMRYEREKHRSFSGYQEAMTEDQVRRVKLIERHFKLIYDYYKSAEFKRAGSVLGDHFSNGIQHPLEVWAAYALISKAYVDQTRKFVTEHEYQIEPSSEIRIIADGKPARLEPISLFPVEQIVRDLQACFVIMPFAPELRGVYDEAIYPAVTSLGLKCVRGDDILKPGSILTQIWESLLQASLVIADLTGANGNVLYELGIAHMIGHNAILLTQDINVIPFDLRHQRHIVYSADQQGLEKLRETLSAAVRAVTI